ncbi:MAG TPA: hypothetical protein VH723_00745 [Candidatus Limnocylindrales bacterium]
MTRRLLERLLTTRARRDREERFSESWHAADAELHDIERAIFRVPLDVTEAARRADRGGRRRPPAVSPGRRRRLHSATLDRIRHQQLHGRQAG